MHTGNPHVLGYLRTSGNHRLLVYANFSEAEQTISANQLRLYGLGYTFTHLLTGETFALHDLNLGPYEFACLAA
jgi:glycosidase